MAGWSWHTVAWVVCYQWVALVSVREQRGAAAPTQRGVTWESDRLGRVASARSALAIVFIFLSHSGESEWGASWWVTVARGYLLRVVLCCGERARARLACSGCTRGSRRVPKSVVLKMGVRAWVTELRAPWVRAKIRETSSHGGARAPVGVPV